MGGGKGAVWVGERKHQETSQEAEGKITSIHLVDVDHATSLEMRWRTIM